MTWIAVYFLQLYEEYQCRGLAKVIVDADELYQVEEPCEEILQQRIRYQ